MHAIFNWSALHELVSYFFIACLIFNVQNKAFLVQKDDLKTYAAWLDLKKNYESYFHYLA